MPKAIVARILNLPGYGVYQDIFDREAQTVTCSGPAPGEDPVPLLPGLRDQHLGDGRAPDGTPGAGSPLGAQAGLAGGGDPHGGPPALRPPLGIGGLPGGDRASDPAGRGGRGPGLCECPDHPGGGEVGPCRRDRPAARQAGAGAVGGESPPDATAVHGRG